MPWEVDGDIGVDPQAAIDWFRSRVPLTRAAWDSLSDQARSKAFFVTGLASLDLVQETMNGLDYAVSQGETFEEFKGRLSAQVTKAWGGQSPYRLQTIFDTNVQLAYGAGRYDAVTELKEQRPYWGLEVVLDGRTSRICRPLAGVVRPADDPWWNGHIPRLHFRCRTALVTYSEAQARSAGITEKAPDVPALAGFGRSPNLAQWEPDSSAYDPQLWEAFRAKQGDTMPAVEQERAKPGTHFAEVRSSAPASVRDTVLRGAQRAGLLGYLERNPIPEVRIVSSLADAKGPFSGEYDPRTRSITVSADRPRAALVPSLGPGEWGRISRVSDVADSAALSMQKTFVHELTHDLTWRWADLLGGIVKAEARIRPVFNAANPVSARAAFDWKEYFCETHAAYVYHRDLLRRLDPGGYAIVEECRKALGIEALP